MDSLTIQGNKYELNIIRQIERKKSNGCTTADTSLYKQFKTDIYITYKQIRHICNPRACEKTTLETVKKSLREHWLEHD
ncbi:hypothetical protein ABE47_03050, partial [Bacillus thuringiensis]|uniref:hypothetical protein n=1 Tax=Bacillus thuringiensis TaxID=1428 RepID=UPI0018CFAF12